MLFQKIYSDTNTSDLGTETVDCHRVVHLIVNFLLQSLKNCLNSLKTFPNTLSCFFSSSAHLTKELNSRFCLLLHP